MTKKAKKTKKKSRSYAYNKPKAKPKKSGGGRSIHKGYPTQLNHVDSGEINRKHEEKLKALHHAAEHARMQHAKQERVRYRTGAVHAGAEVGNAALNLLHQNGYITDATHEIGLNTVANVKDVAMNSVQE